MCTTGSVRNCVQKVERRLGVGTYLSASRHMQNEEKDREKEHLSVVSYNITTMIKKVELEKVIIDEKEAKEDPYVKLSRHCRSWQSVILWPSLLVLIVMSAYMYRRDIPSCSVPSTISLCLLINSVLHGFWPSATILVLICLCTVLMVSKKIASTQKNMVLWKYVSLEMLVWFDYTLLACLLLGLYPEWRFNHWYRYWRRGGAGRYVVTVYLIAFVPILVNALVLNHPVFEMIGIILGVASIASLPSALIRGYIYLLLPLVYLIGCLGCMVMGRFCRNYHLHAQVYCRRGWRQLKKAAWKCE